MVNNISKLKPIDTKILLKIYLTSSRKFTDTHLLLTFFTASYRQTQEVSPLITSFWLSPSEELSFSDNKFHRRIIFFNSFQLLLSSQVEKEHPGYWISPILTDRWATIFFKANFLNHSNSKTMPFILSARIILETEDLVNAKNIKSLRQVTTSHDFQNSPDN